MIATPAVALRFWRRWLSIFTARNLALISGAVAVIYLSATAYGYANALNADPMEPAGGPIGGDYAAFYAAGRLVLEGQFTQLYDREVVASIQQAATDHRIPDYYVAFRNPPFFAPVLAPFAFIDLIPSFAAWSVVSVALLVIAVALTLRTLPQLQAHWKLVALAIAGFCPVYSGLIDGQNAAVSLLLYVLVYVALRERRDAWAGAIAALGLFKPQLFFVLPLVFAASRRWRALLVYAAVASALGLASVVMVGPEGALAWARIIVGYEPGNAAKLAGRMYSFKAFFDVLLPEQTSLALGLSVIFSIVILALVARTWTTRSAVHDNLPLRWTFTMLAALLVDPHLLDYDLTVLVLPALLIAGVLSEAPLWMAAMFVVTAIDVPLTVGPVNLQLGIMLLTALALRVWWHLERSQRAPLIDRTNKPIEIAHQGVALAT
jgi:hypothetical protein